MSISLKPLDEQVMLITGASSGIGLATAERAAERGAKLVLVARSEGALSDIASYLRRRGTDAIAVTCDVANAAEVEAAGRQAIERFRRIDTWVNNAGVSIYARLDEVSETDARRLFDVNFWGVVHGSMTALRYLRRSGGGAIINVGSEVSEAVVPLQGMYSASKHAVKGFTDALRVEVEEVEEAQIAITLIQPTAVDTPYPQHARNYMDREPRLPSPMIEPDDVARAICHAAEHPTRSRKVGRNAVMNTAMSKFMPGLAAKMSARRIDDQHYDEPPRDPRGALYRPSERTAVVAQTHGEGGIDGNQWTPRGMFP